MSAIEAPDTKSKLTGIVESGHTCKYSEDVWSEPVVIGCCRSKLRGSLERGKYAEDAGEVKEKTNPEYYMIEAFRGDFFMFSFCCLSAKEIAYTPV